MNGWKKALVMALGAMAAAGACGRADGIAAPEGARMDGLAPPPDSATTTTQTDSTDGRWGGMIGSGT